MNFATQIIDWYQTNKRDLPWRNTHDPYKIWLSEIILQQTQVKQGLPYYMKFVSSFPTVHDLAAADEQTVLNHWQGLGYYSRARNLHGTAKFIVNELGGNFPGNYAELIKLKGVGDYTASAIASFAFNEKQAVLDGNVFRVLARYHNIDLDINSAEGKKTFKTLAMHSLPGRDYANYNQGIMELGALVCTKHKPVCTYCPVNETCAALRANTVHQLPVKIKKLKKKTRYFNYICLDDGQGLVMKQREKGDIWQGLYDFPLISHNSLIDNPKELIAKESTLKPLLKKSRLHAISDHKHILTHQTIFARFFHFKSSGFDHAHKVLFNDLGDIPVPRLIEKFIAELKD